MPLRLLTRMVGDYHSDLIIANMLQDFDIHGGLTNVQQVLYNWENIVSNALTIDTGFIVLEHDLFQQTVEVATGYILPDALARKPAFNITPVINCLNRPLSEAYAETNDNKSNPLPAKGKYSLFLCSFLQLNVFSQRHKQFKWKWNRLREQ